MDRRTSTPQTPAPGNQPVDPGPNPRPCPTSQAAEGKVLKLGQAFLRTVRFFFPQLNDWLNRLPDGRDQDAITYERRFLAWCGILLYVLQLGSRRQLDFQLDDDATHVLANLNRLANTHQETLPVNGIDYRSLTMMDRSFDPNQFLKTAQDIFFKVQGAWNKQDTATLESLCGASLMKTWQEELTRLRSRGQKNRMDNIALRESEITEVWTESGEDFITVRLFANLLDYTVDEKGAVVGGSDANAVEFEEFWTFTRPVGPNAWKLTAVQQA